MFDEHSAVVAMPLRKQNAGHPILPTASSDKGPVSIFISYSHKDERFRERIVSQLLILQRQGLIEAWSDRQISPGTEWAEDIDQHLLEARLVLLLISPDFMASEYCYDIELRQAMKNHEERVAIVLPIIIRPTDWTDSSFAKLQALPKGGKAVTTWSNRDEAFLDIQIGIKNTLKLCSHLRTSIDSAITQSKTCEKETGNNNTIHNLPLINAGARFWPGTARTIKSCIKNIVGGENLQEVTGIEGIGKTSVALLICYKLMAQQDIHSICWIDAGGGTEQTFERITVFCGIYLSLRPPEELSLADRVIWLIQRWPGEDRPVVLVLDGLNHKSRVALDIITTGLPRRFKIITTSISRIDGRGRIIEHQLLSSSDSVRLVRAYCCRQDITLKDTEEVNTLREVTYGLPILLRVVSYVLKEDADLDLMVLIRRLQKEGALTRLIRKTSLKSEKAWARFNYGWEDLSSLAQEIASYLALLAASPVPWLIIRMCSSGYIDIEEWESSRAELINAGLLFPLGQGLYKLHSGMRDYILAERTIESMRLNYYLLKLLPILADLAEDLPEYLGPQEKERWLSCIPHWEHALEWQNTEDSSFYKFKISLAIGFYYLRSSLYSEAHKWFKLTLSSSNTPDALLRAKAFLALSQAEYELAVYDQSLMNCNEGLNAIDISQLIIAESSLEYADLLNQKGMILHATGSDEALTLFEDSLVIRQNVAKDRCDLFLASLNNIASHLLSINELTKSLDYLQQALNLVNEKNRDLELPNEDNAWKLSSIGIYNTMALYYRLYGANKKASEYLQKAISVAREYLGEEDPDYAKLLHNLAILEEEVGEYHSARQNYRSALAILKVCWGAEDMRTVECQHNLKACENRLEQGNAD
jgi:tetratricopeptide (TPR) repeat protein